jgi:ComF family protein
MQWSRLTHAVLDTLLPAACAICRRTHRPDADGIICQACMVRLVPLTNPQCERCGHPRLSLQVPLPEPRQVGNSVGDVSPLFPLPSCRWCPRLDPAIRAVRSVARMDTGSGADLVHALKYGGWQATAVAMARRMARLPWPRDVIEERVALVPVPLSSTRLRERGYNQAAVLATALAPHWNLPVWSNVLHRIRSGESQVQLTPSERARNVSRAFAVSPDKRAQLCGQHIVLVDDVVTTAATLNAAVQALLEGGARIVSCATFGRAPDPGDRAAPDSDFTRN